MRRRREGLSGFTTLRLPIDDPLLFRMYYDVAGADRLGDAVVIHILFPGGIFPPDADAESIGGAVAGPQHKLVSIAVRVS